MTAPLTPAEAVDIMNSQFLNWMSNGQALALLGYMPVILWEGVQLAEKQADQYYMRVSHTIVLSGQVNLANCEGAPGQTRYRTNGLTFVQVFGPTSDKQVARTALLLATIARNAFRGALAHAGQDAVWFRNARINPLPNENALFRLNVVAEYEYDELG